MRDFPFLLSSGCYTEKASWWDKHERIREEKNRARKRRKKTHEGREKERGNSQKRKAISSDEENSDFDNGLDLGDEEQLEDEFSDNNIKENNMEEPESNAAVEEEI